MYSVLLAAAIGLVFGIGGILLNCWGWGWAIFLGLVVALVGLVLITRQVAKRMQPRMQRVQQQMQARMLDAAMQSFADMLPLARWVPLGTGQIKSQMGAIAFVDGKEDRAVELLQQASLRAPDGQLLLASIHYRRGDKQKAFSILQLASRVNRRHSLLHCVYAWMLTAEDRRDEAIAVLGRFLQKERADAPAKDNLLRLQNKQRMNMGDFGMNWYMLGFERPPASMGQVQMVRKGFRTPPKQRGR